MEWLKIEEDFHHAGLGGMSESVESVVKGITRVDEGFDIHEAVFEQTERRRKRAAARPDHANLADGDLG